jgi:predicted nucleic acid-binding protein
MPNGLTISNSSCLIGLQAVGHLGILELLYSKVVIPPAVEIECGIMPLPWLTVQVVQNQALVRSLRTGFGAGESEAIALAVESAATRLILDDRKARQAAGQFNLSITGTVGVILRAKQEGIITAVRPILEDLVATGFWLSDGLLQQALQLAGE